MEVSVIITSYNYEKYIKEAIDSVLNQTFQDFELIIIDDASTDSSYQIISEYAAKNDKIKVIRNTENQGLVCSLQMAILSASGNWIAILESDDVWNLDYLEKKIDISKQYSSVGFIYNNVEFSGDNLDYAKQKFSKLIERNINRKYPKNMFYVFGFENPVLTMSSVFIKRDLFKSVDFNTPIDKLLDWYLYIQIARKTDFYYVDEKLTKWRQHEKSYINADRKIKFKFANICAYIEILKSEPLNIKLIFFIIYSTVGMCVKRLRNYLFGGN